MNVGMPKAGYLWEQEEVSAETSRGMKASSFNHTTRQKRLGHGQHSLHPVQLQHGVDWGRNGVMLGATASQAQAPSCRAGTSCTRTAATANSSDTVVT
ncbi:hypothetical protein P7K49_024608 [Saguinus oedipus]|uniref:Uncharacterized protein n=1 Tax=Saguinus oedipus TaxID=9490 RepID=A0ABQ9USA7_SAGOE|nr:hypothetical protein P7K49_024608 [Saguinus oedipus]